MKPTRTRPPVRKSTGVRRSEIVDAAMSVIALQGPRCFTARSVARLVGITDGAVFRHFASMDAVLEAVVERMETMLFSDFPPVEEDPVERLGVFFRRRVEVILGNPPLSRLLHSDYLAQLGGPAHAERVGSFKQRSRSFVTACLREAGRKGRLRGPVGPREGTVLVVGAILALAHARTGQGSGIGLESLAKDVWSALEATLVGAGRRSKALGNKTLGNKTLRRKR